MKLLLILFGIISIIAIDARNVQDTLTEQSSDTEENENFLKHVREHAASQRHKRRSRQSPYFGYWNHHDNSRRDYDRQDELLTQILRKLDEISMDMKNPPPPPQPVYIPYPVPYPAPRFTTCRCRTPTNMTFDDRAKPFMEDPRQNWGVVDYPDEYYPFLDGDGSRPINLKPQAPKQPVTNNPLREPSTVAPPAMPDAIPGECEAAILSCCSSQQQENCFSKYGCLKTYESGIACRPEVIRGVIKEFARKYAPQN